MATVTLRRAGDESLGLKVARYEGGPLYIDALKPGGAAEKSGLPLHWSIVSVAGFTVTGARSLLDALEAVKGASAVDVELGEDLTLHLAEAKKRCRSVPAPLSSICEGFAKIRTRRRAATLQEAADSDPDSSPSSPLLPMSFVEDDLDVVHPLQMTYTPPQLYSPQEPASPMSASGGAAA